MMRPILLQTNLAQWPLRPSFEPVFAVLMRPGFGGACVWWMAATNLGEQHD